MSISHLPIIDIGPLRRGLGDSEVVADAIAQACTDTGFFYVTGHNISETLQSRLTDLSSDFFDQDDASKNRVCMAKGGPAWRGFFPVGGELTSGVPDIKEGIYFGAELGASHPLVLAGTPLHGPNQFPDYPAELRDVVLEYISEMISLSHCIMRGVALSLKLPPNYFEEGEVNEWGVGEHTDYGFLTVLKQGDNGGLEVKSRGGWISAPPIPNSFVCNIGDMLDRLTGGLYKSTPHRVKNSSGRKRMSFPFFFDPNFFSKVEILPLSKSKAELDDSLERWDKANPHAFEGTYGDYVISKVGKVFPGLKSKVISGK